MITQTGLKNRHFWMITQTGLNWVSLRCTGFGLIGRRHLKSPGNIIFFLQTWEYIMFLNNKIIFLGIVFNDFYVIKHFLKLCGGWLRLPLLWRKSRQTFPRSNIEHTYVQVHSSPSLEFVCSKKVFSCIFPAICSKTTKDGVSLQSGPVRRLFQRCAANTFSRHALNLI